MKKASNIVWALIGLVVGFAIGGCAGNCSTCRAQEVRPSGQEAPSPPAPMPVQPQPQPVPVPTPTPTQPIPPPPTTVAEKPRNAAENVMPAPVDPTPVPKLGPSKSTTTTKEEDYGGIVIRNMSTGTIHVTHGNSNTSAATTGQTATNAAPAAARAARIPREAEEDVVPAGQSFLIHKPGFFRRIGNAFVPLSFHATPISPNQVVRAGSTLTRASAQGVTQNGKCSIFTGSILP